ncbi:MAG: OmpH family outer membrane protein [Bacteroidaceae bacterium]|nr:OmpH family outer membrane protein [Bacteroidaceae bacterium]
MKKTLLLLLVSPFMGVGTISAQSQAKYGVIHYDSLLVAMPAYVKAKAELADLRVKYENEAAYNDATFKRMFADFLQGQKDFPQSIMLKRQRDLQEAMEKSLAFTQVCDSLLAEAERELLAPVKAQLDSAIVAVGMERGYECIINRAVSSHPFLHPSLTEDAMPFVRKKLLATEP